MNTKSLISGAYGDALGWPVEFLSSSTILHQFGPQGIQSLVLQNGKYAEITDDTQMTLFTAEGLLTAYTANGNQIEYVMDNLREHVYEAYMRWYSTQYRNSEKRMGLLNHPELFNQRAPGGTCLSALASGKVGTVDVPLNDSKGCGGVMRAAPAGLLYGTKGKLNAFEVGAMTGAITHGHPSGYLSAGFLAHFIAGLREGTPYLLAIQDSLKELSKYEGHEECSAIIKRAVELASNREVPTAQGIYFLGEGWVGEEALAISLFCFLRHKHHSFESIMAASVNHNGDSDSTGAILGNMLGAFPSYAKTIPDYTQKIELGNLISQVEKDLTLARLNETSLDPAWENKYGFLK